MAMRPKARPADLKETFALDRAMSGGAAKREAQDRKDLAAKKPSSSAPAKSQRPRGNPNNRLENAGKREAYDRATLTKMAKGGKISEYGGKETYKSKAAMMKHEKAESPAKERAEKMASGGKCRGMGAATKGGSYKG